MYTVILAFPVRPTLQWIFPIRKPHIPFSKTKKNYWLHVYIKEKIKIANSIYYKYTLNSPNNGLLRSFGVT